MVFGRTMSFFSPPSFVLQHGFRSQRSCKTQLVQFLHDTISNLDGAMNRGHKQTDLIIMDLSKAFDKVPQRRLLHKFEYYGIRGSTDKWINSLLSGRTQQVVLDGQASDPVPVLSCVPQGSVLGLASRDGHSSSSSISPTVLVFPHLLQVQRAAVL